MVGEIKHGIIFANDIVDAQKSIALSQEVAPYVDAIKIGITTALRPGVKVFEETKKLTGKPLLGDFKVADIGMKNKQNEWEGTNNKIVGELVRAGADYVICHTIVGTSSIQESVDTAHKYGGKVLTLPYMTHKGAEVFFDLHFAPEHAKKTLTPVGLGKVADAVAELEYKKKINTAAWRLPYTSVSDAILLIGEEVGVDGYIGPANKPAVLRDYRHLSQSKLVCSPGIGRQEEGGKSEEQQLAELFDAVGENCGAIIGSGIYKAPKPGEAAANYNAMRNSALERLKHMVEC